MQIFRPEIAGHFGPPRILVGRACEDSSLDSGRDGVACEPRSTIPETPSFLSSFIHSSGAETRLAQLQLRPAVMDPPQTNSLIGESLERPSSATAQCLPV